MDLIWKAFGRQKRIQTDRQTHLLHTLHGQSSNNIAQGEFNEVAHKWSPQSRPPFLFSFNACFLVASHLSSLVSSYRASPLTTKTHKIFLLLHTCTHTRTHTYTHVPRPPLPPWPWGFCSLAGFTKPERGVCLLVVVVVMVEVVVEVVGGGGCGDCGVMQWTKQVHSRKKNREEKKKPKLQAKLILDF